MPEQCRLGNWTPKEFAGVAPGVPAAQVEDAFEGTCRA